MARGRKSRQRAPRSGLKSVTGNGFQVDPFEVRNEGESIRSVETTEMPASNLVSEQVISTAPNLNQSQGIVVSDCVGPGVTYDFRMRDSRATSSLPGSSSDPPMLMTLIAQPLQGINQEIGQNCVSEPTHSRSMAPLLILWNTYFNPMCATVLGEMPIARSGPATRFMAARRYDLQLEGPRFQAFGGPAFVTQPPPLNHVSEAQNSASYSTPKIGRAHVCTMAHPVSNLTTQGTRYNSSHPFVSSQVTAPSMHSAEQIMQFNSQASSLPEMSPSGVAPVNFSATAVSQPTRYSIPMFHTQAVAGPYPATTQGYSATHYGPIASNPGQQFFGQTVGAQLDPNYPRNPFPRNQYTSQQSGCFPSGYPQQQLIRYTPPSVVMSKPNYHYSKGKHMDAPLYKGFSDPKTPYDFILELDKFQTILAYSDRDMLFRVIPMVLYGEAYQWFRSVQISFPDFNDFKRRLTQRFQVVYRNQTVNLDLDSSFVSKSDLRVVSNEYSAYSGDETNEFPVLQTSYRDYGKITQTSGAQSSFSDCSQNHA